MDGASSASTAEKWLARHLKRGPRRATELLLLARKEHRGWGNIRAAIRSLGAVIIRTSFGRKKRIYWALHPGYDKRWVCCEFTPIDPIHVEWIEEILDRFGYQETEASKEIPDIGEWFIRDGRYYWAEIGPCPKNWRTEDPSEI